MQLLSLFFGNYHIFTPKVPIGHKFHQREVLERMHIFFGPFPLGYQTLADSKTLDYLADIMESIPKSARKPFKYSKDTEFEPEDRAFLVKIMNLDPRERPTAEQLINDQWFS
jgi:serine/threonine protein kinase